MNVVVTGSRDWGDVVTVCTELADLAARFPSEQFTLLSGGCRGLDRIAEQAARQLGWQVKVFPADWDRHGRSAGHMRNQQMVDAGPDRCLGFVLPCRQSGCPQRGVHGSHGTTNMIGRARAAGIPCKVIFG